MFRYLKKIVKLLDSNAKQGTKDQQEVVIPFKSLGKNIAWFKENCFQTEDMSTRVFSNQDLQGIKGTVIFLDGMVDKTLIDNNILKPLQKDVSLIKALTHRKDVGEVKGLANQVIPLASFDYVENLNIGLTKLLSGNTLLLFENSALIYSFDTKGWQERSVTEPEGERVVRGPRVGFVEKIGINLGLIRRRSNDRNFVFKKIIVGEEAKTDVYLIFHQKNVMQDVLKELITRIQNSKINNLYDSGILEQYIEDNPYSILPQIQYTERPDKVVASVMEGRIGILVDGSPMALLVPAPIINFFQSSEDYYEKWTYGTIIRWTRYIAAFTSSSLPALYIAIISYHPELLPTDLAFSIGVARLGVPFPAFFEALLMEFTLEVLQEAGIRLPQPVGQTVSIVGGLVIGQAAVEAGIISPIMVIIISVTAISSFTIPSYNLNLATRLFRVPYMLAAVIFGFYGLVLAWMATVIHICNTKTLGRSYLEGVIPVSSRLLDTIIRAPLKFLNNKS